MRARRKTKTATAASKQNDHASTSIFAYPATLQRPRALGCLGCSHLHSPYDTDRMLAACFQPREPPATYRCTNGSGSASLRTLTRLTAARMSGTCAGIADKWLDWRPLSLSLS